MKIKTITVTYGPESFVPIPYHSFTNGPFSMTVEVEEGEKSKDVAQTAHNLLKKIADRQFKQKRDAFYERYKNRTDESHST